LRLSAQPPNMEETCPIARSGVIKWSNPKLSCAAPVAFASQSRGASTAS
jgi:hypothetical protein